MQTIDDKEYRGTVQHHQLRLHPNHRRVCSRMTSRHPDFRRRTLMLVGFGLVVGGLATSCDARDGANGLLIGAMMAPGYALLAPWALGKVVVNAFTEDDFQRQLAQQQHADPRHIPPDVVRTIAERSEFTADSLEQLLETTGLAPYRKDVPIVSFGTTDQDMWIYYRTDAALNARFDAVARRFVGPIRNLQAKSHDKTAESPDRPILTQ